MSATMVPGRAVVRVKLSGSDNRASVLGWGITASSTHSPPDAARAVVKKLAARIGIAPEAITLLLAARTGEWMETWVATWKEPA